MKGYWHAFRVEIVWILLLVTLALVAPGTLYSDGGLCYNTETYPPCDDSDCGCDLAAEAD